MKDWLINKCRESETFSWALVGVGTVIMFIIAFM